MKSLAAIYIVGVPIGFVLFFLGFKLGFFSGDPIIFYRGLKILTLTSILQWLLLALITLYALSKQISLAHAFAATMGSVAICAIFLIVIPVSLDRSVSVFLLGYMQNLKKPISKNELETVLINKYVKEYGSIDRRMEEQITSGNIEKTPNGKYVLTKQGERFILISRVIGKSFNVDMKFLNPSLEIGDNDK